MKVVAAFCVVILCTSPFVHGAPMLLEASIAAKESLVKIMRPSMDMLKSLESKFGVPVGQLFELPELRRVPELDVASVEGRQTDAITAVIAAKSPDGGDSYLMAPLAVPPKVLERLLTDDTGAFLQILLPGHEVPTVPPKQNEGEDAADGSRPAVMVTRDPTPEESVARFFQKFIKINLSEENRYIPESVRLALSSAQQVLVHPKTFLQIPEGQTNDNSRVFTITSATPVDIVLGLFQRVGL